MYENYTIPAPPTVDAAGQNSVPSFMPTVQPRPPWKARTPMDVQFPGARNSAIDPNDPSSRALGQMLAQRNGAPGPQPGIPPGPWRPKVTDDSDAALREKMPQAAAQTPATYAGSGEGPRPNMPLPQQATDYFWAQGMPQEGATNYSTPGAVPAGAAPAGVAPPMNPELAGLAKNWAQGGQRPASYPAPEPKLGQQFTVGPDGRLYPMAAEGVNRYAAPGEEPPAGPMPSSAALDIQIVRGGRLPGAVGGTGAGGLLSPEAIQQMMQGSRHDRMAAHLIAQTQPALLQAQQHQATLAFEREKLAQERDLMAQRMALEYGPAKAAQEIFNSTFVAGTQKHGDLALAGREAQQAKDAFLAQFGGATTPALPGAAPAPGQPHPPMTDPSKPVGAGGAPPMGRFTDAAVQRFLGDQGIVDPATGVAKGGELDPLKLAEALYKNPDIAEGGRVGIARAALKVGVNTAQLEKLMQQRLIYLHQKAHLANERGAASYGPYTVSPTGDRNVGTGYVIAGPNASVWHGTNPLWKPTEALYPGLTQDSRGQYAGQAAALAQIMAAIEAEVRQQSAAGGGTPPQAPR